MFGMDWLEPLKRVPWLSGVALGLVVGMPLVWWKGPTHPSETASGGTADRGESAPPAQSARTRWETLAPAAGAETGDPHPPAGLSVAYEQASADHWIDQELMPKLTVRQKVGQLLMLNFGGAEPPRKLLRRFSKWCPGGFILERNNLQSQRQAARLAEALQGEGRKQTWGVELFLATDQEGGKIWRLPWHRDQLSQEELGRQGRERTRREGQRTAEALRSAGLNMCLGPVLDVLTEPKNPIIGQGMERSYGSDPGVVGDHGVAYIQGMQERGVLATAKHFPGHGATDRDSHKVLPKVHLGFSDWVGVHLDPFRRAVQEGQIEAVMTAHVAYRFDGQDYVNGALPATLTPYFLTEVLRLDLGFRGIVLSDSMMMGGLKQSRPWRQALVDAVNAGVDLLVLTPEAGQGMQSDAFATLLKAVDSHQISEARLNEAVRRILRVKMDYGLLWRQSPGGAATRESR